MRCCPLTQSDVTQGSALTLPCTTPFFLLDTDIAIKASRHQEAPMDSQVQMLLSQQDLARRWGRSETAIGLASAVGVGPRYVKIDGAIRYTVEDIQRYERACLFFNAG